MLPDLFMFIDMRKLRRVKKISTAIIYIYNIYSKLVWNIRLYTCLILSAIFIIHVLLTLQYDIDYDCSQMQHYVKDIRYSSTETLMLLEYNRCNIVCVEIKMLGSRVFFVKMLDILYAFTNLGGEYVDFIEHQTLLILAIYLQSNDEHGSPQLSYFGWSFSIYFLFCNPFTQDV